MGLADGDLDVRVGARVLGPVVRAGQVAGGDGAVPDGATFVRLWAFGNALVRQRVREHATDWRDGLDWFVA